MPPAAQPKGQTDTQLSRKSGTGEEKGGERRAAGISCSADLPKKKFSCTVSLENKVFIKKLYTSTPGSLRDARCPSHGAGFGGEGEAERRWNGGSRMEGMR